MHPLHLEGIATQRRAFDLAAAADHGTVGHTLRPSFSARVGRLLVGAGTRLLAASEG